MTQERSYWAQFRSGRRRRQMGPYPTRDAALQAVLAAGFKIKHKTLTTGYGTGGAWFDIQWHDDETRPVYAPRTKPRVEYKGDWDTGKKTEE